MLAEQKEPIKVLSMTEYCGARKLAINKRLDLFVQICSTVQHAHRKAIFQGASSLQCAGRVATDIQFTDRRR